MTLVSHFLFILGFLAVNAASINSAEKTTKAVEGMVNTDPNSAIMSLRYRDSFVVTPPGAQLCLQEDTYTVFSAKIVKEARCLDANLQGTPLYRRELANTQVFLTGILQELTADLVSVWPELLTSQSSSNVADDYPFIFSYSAFGLHKTFSGHRNHQDLPNQLQKVFQKLEDLFL